MRERLISIVVVTAMLLSLVPAVASAEKTDPFGSGEEHAAEIFDSYMCEPQPEGFANDIPEAEDIPETEDRPEAEERAELMETSGTCGENVTWTLDDSGTLTISGTGDMTDYSYYYGSPFYSRTGINNVIISNGVTSIGNYAFRSCSSLTSISIPDSVTSIGYYAFNGCSSLTSISIPDSVTSIGAGAFYDTDYYKNKNNWSNGILYIGNHCIDADTTISGEISIPEGVTSIGEDAFEDCRSLTSISIPDSVTSISYGAFHDCRSLTSISIPGSVTSIGDWAFCGCSSLTSISIPDSVTSIGDHAFYGCSSLTSISIPDSVTSIGDWAFYGCRSLTSISIPDSVTSIGDWAFCGCSSLTSISIPDSVTSIGNEAFYECSSLTSISIPDSVTSIGGSAFDDCRSLTSISIPDSVTSISYAAFRDCSSLTSISIPDSVTSIGEDAFRYCSSLKDVYYSGSEAEWKNILIGSANKALSDATIHYNSTGGGGTSPTAKPALPGNSITVEFSGGDDIILDTEKNTYNKENFELITELQYWQLFDDNGTPKPKNVNIEVTLPEGYSFDKASDVKTRSYSYDKISSNKYISETIYLKDPPAGKSSVKARLTGDNISEQNITYDLEVSQYKFNADIYRANYLLNSETGAAMENTYFGMNTPSKELRRAGKESGMDGSVAAWKALMDTLDMVDNPSSIADYAFKKKDMYTAIIMSLLEASVNYKVIGFINNDITKQSKTLLGDVISGLKTSYTLDQLEGVNLSKWSDKQITDLRKEINNSFKLHYQNAGALSKELDYFGKAIKYGKDIQTVCEQITAYYNIRQLSDSMKQILSDMYKKCPSDNIALKAALFDCISIIDSGNTEFVGEMAIYADCVAGKDIAQFCFDKYWSGVKANFCLAHPAAFAFQAAYIAGKTISQVMFNADGIQEKYCNILALLEAEELLNSVYSEVKSKFETSRSEDRAKAYNSGVDIMFNMLDTDCKYALSFISAVDKGMLSKILELTGDNTTDDLTKKIKTIQNACYQFHEQVLTSWLFRLEADDPARFNEYSYLLGESTERMRKKYDIKCPVDVYVYDSDGLLAASVIDNVPQCREKDDLTIGMIGDEKVLYIHGDDEYTLVYKGKDTGTMDVSVTEYENNDESRKVYFNALELTDGIEYTSVENGQVSEENAYVLVSDNIGNIAPDYDSKTVSDTDSHTASAERGYFTRTIAVSQELHTGENAEISAYIPFGYDFVGWTSDAGEDIFEDPNSIITTVRMPDRDVIITANIVRNDMQYELTDIASDGGEVTVNMKANEAAENAVLIISGYDEDGRLKAAYSETITPESNEIKADIDFSDLYTIEAFVWDSHDKMRPLSNSLHY